MPSPGPVPPTPFLVPSGCQVSLQPEKNTMTNSKKIVVLTSLFFILFPLIYNCRYSNNQIFLSGAGLCSAP
jgi:hypothetical protein